MDDPKRMWVGHGHSPPLTKPLFSLQPQECPPKNLCWLSISHDFPIVTIGVLLFGWWFQTVFIVHFIFFSSWLKPPTSFGFCYSRKPWLFTMKYWGFPVKVPNKTNPLRFWLTGPTASRILADLASEDSSRLLSSFRCVLKGDRSGNPSGGTEDQKTPPKSKVARKSPN